MVVSALTRKVKEGLEESSREGSKERERAKSGLWNSSKIQMGARKAGWRVKGREEGGVCSDSEAVPVLSLCVCLVCVVLSVVVMQGRSSCGQAFTRRTVLASAAAKRRSTVSVRARSLSGERGASEGGERRVERAE